MLTIDINVALKDHACAFRLSSNWSYFSEECDHLKLLFSRLKYPDKLISSAITHFIAVKVSDELDSPADTNESDPVHIALLFKDQALADNQYLWNQLKDLSQKILITVQPVFVQDLKLREFKPPARNKQCFVFKCKCNLCNAGYGDFTRWHLHQRFVEHKGSSSSIGKHSRDARPFISKGP